MVSSKKIREIRHLVAKLEDALSGLVPDEKKMVSSHTIASLLDFSRQVLRVADRVTECNGKGGQFPQTAGNGSRQTARDRVQYRIHESMLSLLENSIDAVYLRNLKTDQYDYMSPVIEQITGFSVKELASMKTEEVLARIHPDDCGFVESELARVAQGGKGILEYRFKGKDGAYRWLADSVTVKTDCKGLPLFRIGVVRDVSEQKHMEQSLRESEERYRSLVELSPDALFINVGNRVVFVNQAGLRLFGASAGEQLLGKTPFDLFHPDYHEVIRKRIARQLQGENAPLIEEKVLRLDGSRVDVEVAAAPFMTEKGMAIQVILRDITERKRAEEKLVDRQQQLEELNRTLEERVAEEVKKNREKDYLLMQQSRQAELGEMINIIAHQWRQPLNIIGLHAQLLSQTCAHGDLDSGFLNETVKGILDLVMHMSNTIEDFRNFLRPERERSQFNIKDTIARTYRLIAESFKESVILVDIEGDSDVVVNGYPNEYAQAVMNILNNARDALIERRIDHPRIRIRIAKEGERSVVTISDNAGGVAEELLQEIFEPYFTTKEGAKGTGIGLYMSKTIVEKSMQGHLSVRNSTEGAEFRIEV
jgi:PAS domain S-box-containing protein